MDAAVLKFRGEAVAEAWYQSEGDAVVLVIQVQKAVAGLTVADLLTAAGVSDDEFESWRTADGLPNTESRLPLPPEPGAAIHVRLKAPAAAEDLPPEVWQYLETAWRTILGLEASIDSSRLGMESLRSEMDAAFKRPLATEDKLNALQNDVAQWTKAKSRIHHSVPKAREFVHRATWALAQPERKSLEEIFKQHIEPRIPLPDADQVRLRLEHLQKDRQVLLAQGNTVNQECRGILGEVQRAVSTLQRNAVARKRNSGRERGKQF